MLKSRKPLLLSQPVVGIGTFSAILVLASLPGCVPTPRATAPANAVAPQPAGHSDLPQPRQVVPSNQIASYAGTAQCIGCHPGQAGQQHSRHARTLAQTDARAHSDRFRKSRVLSDPLEGMEYQTAVVDGNCVLQASDGARVSAASADYAFGSGSVAVTYVNRQSGVSTELRLTHYTVGNTWGYTPGQRTGRRAGTPIGSKLSAETERACFSCHSTVLAEENGALKPERSMLGVGCEACHGAGASHIEAAKRGDSDLRMPDLSKVRQRVSLELCGGCHRTPGSVDLNNAGVAAQLPRLQAVALSFSRCFKKGGVSCMTCHDPHNDADSKRMVDYNQKCLSCHSSVRSGQVTCKAGRTDDCVSCHMPKQDIGMPGAVRFRNHWIKAWK